MTDPACVNTDAKMSRTWLGYLTLLNLKVSTWLGHYRYLQQRSEGRAIGCRAILTS